MQLNSYETARLIKTQNNGLRKQLYKNGKNPHKNSYFSDSVKPYTCLLEIPGVWLDRGTQVAGQSRLVQLIHCVNVKKGGSFYTRFQPSRKGWSCLGDLKEKGRNMKRCQILALSKICLFMPRLIISLF